MKKIKINESKILPPVLHKNNIIQCFKLKKMKIDNKKKMLVIQMKGEIYTGV